MSRVCRKPLRYSGSAAGTGRRRTAWGRWWLLLGMAALPLTGHAGIQGLGPCLTAEFHDISIRDALQVYADFERLNIVMDTELAGKVDLTLRCVSADLIRESLLSLFDLTVVEKKGLLLVSQRDKLGRKVTRRRLVRLWHADPDQVMDTFKDAQARMVVAKVEASNAIYLEGSGEDVQRMAEAIALLDVPARQYFIDVQLISASSDLTQKLGAKFNASPSYGNLGLNSFQDYALAAATSGFSVVYSRAAGELLRLELQAQRIDGHSRLLSSPRLVAYENKTAEINQGVEIPYQIQQSNGAYKIQFKKASLSVKVTPRPSSEDNVYLDVYVSKNTPGLQTAQGVQIETREITTSVRMGEGETLMLGGIYERTDTRSESGIPGLRNVPVLGYFFGASESKQADQELILLITPKRLEG